MFDAFDTSTTTVAVAGTLIIAASTLLMTRANAQRTNTTTKIPTAAQERSASLYLPSNHYLTRLATQSPGSFPHNDPTPTASTSNERTRMHTTSTEPNNSIEASLQTEIKALAKRETKLTQQLEQERINVETLSKQVKDLLLGYSNEYSGIFGKSKEMVDREHQGFRTSQKNENNALHLKLAALEHQSLMTRRALEKSKAQTEMAKSSHDLLRGSSGKRTPVSNADRVTFDTDVSSMTLLRDAIALIRSESLRFDSKSIQRVGTTLSKISASGDSASILMGRSLGVIKAALTEFCHLDTFTKTNSEWNVSLVDLVGVPKRRRGTLVNSLTLAVAAFDTLIPEDDSDECPIEESVVDGFCLNCRLLATLAEFSHLQDDECRKRAHEREGHKQKVREFDRRGSTIALQAAGLIPQTPRGHY